MFSTVRCNWSKPVMSLHALFPFAAGDGAHRTNLPGAQHQTRAQPRVAHRAPPNSFPAHEAYETGPAAAPRPARALVSAPAPTHGGFPTPRACGRRRPRVSPTRTQAARILAPRLFGVDERLQQPGAAVEARSRRRPPERPGPTRGCGATTSPAAAQAQHPMGGCAAPYRPTEVSRARRRRALGQPDPAQPAMVRTRLTQLGRHGPAPRGVLLRHQRFQIRRCSSVSTRRAKSRTSPTVPGTTAGAPAEASRPPHTAAGRPTPGSEVARRRGRPTTPSSSRTANGGAEIERFTDAAT